MTQGISGWTSPQARRLDDDHDVQSIAGHAPPAARRSAEHPACPSTAIDAHASSAAAEFCRNRVNAPSNDKILYVGMNEKSASAEIAGLNNTGASVTPIRATDATTKATLDRVEYDLTTKAGVTGFADALAARHNLSKETAKALAEVLERCPTKGRDELAQIAMVWARGEAGAAIPSRLVISGHHGDESFMGSFTEDDLVRLAHALPNAAKQVEDIHFSGCQTHGNVNLRDRFTKAFPNLRTVWGYEGSAPEAPVHHLQSWERATRGRQEVISRSSVPAAQNAVAWSLKGGIVGKQLPLAERRQACAFADGRFDAYKTGRMTNQDAAYVDYTAYMSIAQSADATPQERASAASKAAVLLRVRKYEHVREHFQEAFGPRIASACAKARIAAPNFAKLSREEAVARLEEIKDKVVANDPGLRDALTGLAELDPGVIKQDWCE